MRAQLGLVKPPNLEEIRAGCSPRSLGSGRDAWTAVQLAAWGVPWPPPAGWKARLIERRAVLDRKMDIDEREEWEKPQGRAQQAPRFFFVARYSTMCDGCRKRVRPGQDAVKMNDGTTRHDLPGCILATAGQATYSDRKGARGPGDA
jgi:hypothetical protein